MFRDMNIGTAKPHQLSNHFLIDVVSPNEMYTAFKFRRAVESIISFLWGREQFPIISGGSMFYFEMLNSGLIGSNLKNSTTKRVARGSPVSNITADWAASQPTKTAAFLFQVSRTSKLVELFLRLGITAFNRMASCYRTFSLVPLVINPNVSSELERRIISRFDGMLASGFVEEVMFLKTKYHLEVGAAAMKLVGYHHCFKYITGSLSFSEMRGGAILSSLNLVRKQITWLRAFRRLQIPEHKRELSGCLCKELGLRSGTPPKSSEFLNPALF
ncbi:tRNA delta(2)-isopentenylpyrophosphatetransferase [Candidatus Tremblaya phenacola PAVE]|nr:tRNA delta(2)-isopentenylpyrophosphatetransferase [Candidatus Tremblaya phenacola PAVE]